MADEHRFQVNLRGVVELLAKHLYSNPQLFLREMLQNAVDAITARKRLDPAHEGSIRLEVSQGLNPAPTLTVIDDGIGMSEAELHQFLATIGESSKRDGSGEFLGQFGIGMLAGFMVSDEIVAVSKSVRDDEPAVEWRGKQDGTYEVRRLNVEVEPGTRVSLQARPDVVELFDVAAVREQALNFGRLLPHAIYVSDGATDGKPINDEPPPWRRTYDNERLQREALLEYGRSNLREKFLDAVPVSSAAGGVDGAAYISAHSVNLAVRRKHQVYLKNMLLSDEAEGLLPDWAFFVKAVVNVERLRPVASREGFYVDERLEACREELGACLRRHLMTMPERDPARFQRFLAVHSLALKSLAVDDDECFCAFIDWLSFETTHGRKTVGELRASGEEIRYVDDLAQFVQIAKVAQAQGTLVVNAGYVYEAELLTRLSEIFSDCRTTLVDLASFSASLAEPSSDDVARGQAFIDAAEDALRPYGCEIELKQFEPRELPVLLSVDREARFLRSVEQAKETADPLFGGILESLASQNATKPNCMVYFNVANSIVSRLCDVERAAVQARAAEILYVQALLLAQQALTSRELQLLSRGLGGLIDATLS